MRGADHGSSLDQVYYEAGSRQVLVGVEKRLFEVDMHTLNKRSVFFKAAFGPNWNAADRGKLLELPEDEPLAFLCYLNYVGGLVDTPDSNLTWSEWPLTPLGGPASQELESFKHVIRAYCFADKIGDLKAANFFIGGLREHTVRHKIIFVDDCIEFVYERTPEKSPLRKLVADFYVHNAPPSLFDKLDTSLPADFLLDVVRALRAVKGTDVASMTLA